MTIYKKREIVQGIIHALADMPVVVLTGMRQVGKSTILREDKSFKGRHYISLDDLGLLEAAKRNPEGLLRGDIPITVDEAQKCPELLTVIKQMVDQERKPGHFLLSGSANFALLKGIAESLAGRAVYLTLHPFNRREKIGDVNSQPFLIGFFHTLEIPEIRAATIEPSEILLGGMPPVCLEILRNPTVWFKGYEQTYIERDLRQISQVTNLLEFRRLLQMAAIRTGQILNLSELCRDAKLSSTTTSRYLNLMETSFIIHRLSPFLGNLTSRLIKSPKLYLSDSGLACHFTGIEDLSSQAHKHLLGAMHETYVAQNLSSLLEAHMPQARLYFWNIQGRHEVDFIIEAGRKVMAIEVTAATRWTKGDLSGLRAFLGKTPNCHAALLAYNGTQAIPLDKRLWAIPLGLLLS